VTRNIHHKAMADTARGADAGVPCHHGAYQLIGTETAFHQGLGLALAHKLDGLCRGIVAVRRFDERIARNVQP